MYINWNIPYINENYHLILINKKNFKINVFKIM